MAGSLEATKVARKEKKMELLLDENSAGKSDCYLGNGQVVERSVVKLADAMEKPSAVWTGTNLGSGLAMG
jgi:hypothetical protein